MRALAMFIAAVPMLAAVSGTVVNKTTGKPQTGVNVTLTGFGQGGMQRAGSATTDSAGRFRIDSPADGMHLLQAEYRGVTYNMMARQGQPLENIELPVYEVAAKGEAPVSQHMMLIEPGPNALAVRETVIFENSENVTYHRPGTGVFEFFLPEAAQGKVQVRVVAPQGMPVTRPAKETQRAGVYTVDYPIKPGETRFDLSYEMPAATAFEGRILHKAGTTRLVAPRGVSFNSADIEAVGQEPSTQATVYTLKNPTFKIAIEGTGALSSEGAPQQGEEETGPEESFPRIYRALYWILGLTGAALLFAFLMLLRKRDLRA